jgi:hypothetical protein
MPSYHTHASNLISGSTTLLSHLPLHHRLALPLPVPPHPLSKLHFKLELTRQGHLQEFKFVPLPQTLGVTPTPSTPTLPLPLDRGIQGVGVRVDFLYPRVTPVTLYNYNED